MPDTEKLDLWAVLEIMGHQRFAGRVSEQVVAGIALVRVDVPEVIDRGEKVPGFSKLFGGSSIFCITPVDEDTARMAALNFRSRPLETFHFVQPQRQPALPYDGGDDDEDYYDEEPPQ